MGRRTGHDRFAVPTCTIERRVPVFGGRIPCMARIRFAGKYYPLPDEEVDEYKANLIALAADPMQASFALKVRRDQGQDWLWITPGASVVIESSDEIPD